MAQDIRELFKNDKGLPGGNLPLGHEKRFMARLDEEFGESQSTSNRFMWMKIAAAIVVVFAVGGLLMFNPLSSDGMDEDTPALTETSVETPAQQVKLSDMSPEFKKVEDYYLASINVELAQLQVTPENKALIDSFMTQLEELNMEYSKLNEEMTEVGVNEQSVSALISNLQLRLDLLFRLKEKLNELKNESTAPGVAASADDTKSYTI